MLVAKFCYNEANKKVRLARDQFTWETICAILMKSFVLPNQEYIQLKYKDFEDDEITVSSDEDLLEAYNIHAMKNLVKFFVYYSGVLSESQRQPQNSGYSKIERPISIPQSPRKSLICSQVAENQLSLAQEASNVEIEQTKTVAVKIDVQDLQSLLNEVLFTPENMKKVQEKLKSQAAKQETGNVQYSVDTDFQALTNYFMTSISTIMNKKIEEDASVSQTTQAQDSRKSSSASGCMLDRSLRESVYEGGSDQDALCVSSREPEIKMTSINSSLECKDLSGTMGVRLVVKFENGKAKFVMVPANEYSLIEKSEKSSLNETRISSRENKGPEFANKILKGNVHDLDEDLPAPYDKKVVEKYVKGLEDSVYEKIY